MKEYVLNKLPNKYELEKLDMSDLSDFSNTFMHFHNESYNIKNIGHLMIMEMKSLFNLMKMQVIVITPQYKDLSFVNFDIIRVLSNETDIIEMYKSSIEDEDISKLIEVKNSYHHIKDNEIKAAWYDSLRLDCSISKKGKINDINQMKYDYLDVYLDLLDKAKDCDYNLKQEKNSEYVDALVNKGGMAVNTITKIIGKDKCSEFVKKYMFNTID